MTLFDVLIEAEGRGADPEWALFAASASRDVHRAAWVLSASVSLRPSELEMLLRELWSHIDASSAVQGLGQWSIVEPGEDGWRVTETLRVPLADEFRTLDRAGWERAHRAMAAREEAESRHMAGEPAFDRWFADGRVAYHLAAFDAAASVRTLGTLFTQPPQLDPDGARRWLTTLALRQDAELASQPRERSMFHAYDVYTRGVASQALGYLTPVYADDLRDPYTAYALYLSGVLIGLSRPGEGLGFLDRSMQLSAQLGLLEPEIRARHSFAWTIFGLINSELPIGTDVVELLRRAKRAADLNEQRADLYGSGLLIARSRWTAIIADWLLVTETEQADSERVAISGLRTVNALAAVRDRLVQYRDPRAAILTTANAMAVFGHLGRIDEAIEQGEAAIDVAQWAEAPASIGRVEAEAERLLEHADVHQRERIESLLRELHIFRS